MAKLRITYVKSMIGYSQDQKDTVRSLGLRKLNSVAIHNDTPAIRGMAFKVRHLVSVEEVADDAAPETRRKSARPVVRATLAPVGLNEQVAETTPAPRTPSAATKAADDDLELIEGIGPKIAGVLKDAGIATFAQLAATDVERLKGILHEGEIRIGDPTTWPEQAALLAAGKQEEFEKLTDELKGGRRV